MTCASLFLLTCFTSESSTMVKRLGISARASLWTCKTVLRLEPQIEQTNKHALHCVLNLELHAWIFIRI